MAKKQKAAAAPEADDIFAALGIKEEGEPAATQTDDEVDVKALMARIDRMEKENQNLRTSSHTLSMQRAEPERKAPALKEVDLSGLPDPMSDPTAYQKALSARINDTLTHNLQTMTSAQAEASAAEARQQAKVKDLWDSFVEAQPELAAHKDLVEVAAKAVAERAAARGIDMNLYMFGDSQRFFADVAAETTKRFGKAIEALKEDDEGDEAPAASPGIHAHRTSGIMGGVPSSGKGAAPAAPKADMVSDLHAIQRKMGIF